MNCYRLADRFHQRPEVFLSMPIWRVQMHVHYTVKLIKAQAAARRSDDAD
jgi:hypothetical protein